MGVEAMALPKLAIKLELQFEKISQ